MIEGAGVWFIVKIFYLLAVALYIAFSAVVVRQVYLMTNTLEVGLEFVLRLLSWVHLGVALTIFLLFLGLL